MAPTPIGAAEELVAVHLTGGLTWGESPRWSAGALVVSDSVGRRVVRVLPDGDQSVLVEIDGQPSGLGHLPDGSLLISSMLEARLLRLDLDGGLASYADLSGLARGYTTDMAVDAAGRAFVDDIGFRFRDGEGYASGRLLVVDPDGRARVVADDLAFPNGIVVDEDAGLLHVCESAAGRVTTFDVADDGSLDGRRIAFDLTSIADGEAANPDGLALDAAGGLWVALPQARRFVRLVGDEVTHSIDVGTEHAVACCTGGDDGDVLFLTIAQALSGPGSFVEDVVSGNTRSRVGHVSLRRLLPAPEEEVS